MSGHVYEIIVTPDDGPTGLSLIALFSGLSVNCRFRRVILADIECNGDRSWCRREPFELTVSNVIDFLPRVGQFDWATFFFLGDSCPASMTDDWFNQLFDAADLVVRAVDDTWFYVYSSEESDATLMQNAFTSTATKRTKDSISHPF